MEKSKSLGRSCLLITYGPVPTPEFQKVEGGGMRVWGLAKGLLSNGIDVTVAVNSGFPQSLQDHEGIKLINWDLDQNFIDTLNDFDTVLVSYCMGDPSVFIADNINDDIQLILDVYVPIYVEVSARESKDIEQEYKNYFEDLKRHNHVLKRGDFFICASQTQKIFYTGLLSSLGILNPRSYREERLLIVPFGIHDLPARANNNPYDELGISLSDKTVLWFGGLYPWFRVDELLNAIKTLSIKDSAYKFVFVGGKNPFNPNPDFSRQYEKTLKFAKQNNLLDSQMFFVDWVDFDDRINWYKHADFVISINQPGEENAFSWRTRVMDYVWGEIITLTNGGDPLSEDLLDANAAIRLPSLSSESMVAAVENIYAKGSSISSVQKSLVKLKPRYFWDNITIPVARLISLGNLPNSHEASFRKQIKMQAGEPPMQTSGPEPIYFAKARKAARFAPKVIRYARKKGLRQSTRMGLSAIKNQTKKRTLPNQKQYVFLSHPLDNSGAPLVLIQIINDLIEKHPSIRRHSRVIAPYATPNRKSELRNMGLKLEKAAHGLSAPLTGLQLSLKKDDFVLMNTCAIFDNYRNYVFNLLGANRLTHAYWFIHEDIAQTKVVAPQLLEKENLNRIHKLLESKKLTILVPSKRIQNDYNKLFKSSSVLHIDLRIDINDKYLTKKVAKDYEQIDFLLSGTASDGRKGQLIALAAFQQFILKYRDKQPTQYRDFTLSLVGVNEDYISDQIKTIGKTVLGKKLSIYPSIPRDQAMDITGSCNAVICCSLNETFALYVAEGMAMGHVVLRNNSAGIDEQLEEGLNGYYIDSNNIEQFSDVIEKLLNKSVSNLKLMSMGEKSKKIAERFLNQNYSSQINIKD